ncbi:FeoB-associated Cys-rich membrane protein [Paenibacillus jiagnxiensis]|uniref:FeoB-associated Cys-rich membrane protein n=1 Tax=Paenibacillus jiagnxiensis TaxID=3228926 RepID=UPI00339DF16F
MLVSIVIGILVFGYAGWTIAAYVRRTKAGKCAGCSLSDSCGASQCSPAPRPEAKYGEHGLSEGEQSKI